MQAFLQTQWGEVLFFVYAAQILRWHTRSQGAKSAHIFAIQSSEPGLSWAGFLSPQSLAGTAHPTKYRFIIGS